MRISIRRSLQGVILALSLIALGGVAFNYLAMREVSRQVHLLADDELIHLSTLKAVSDAFAITIVDAVHKAVDAIVPIAAGRRSIAEARADAARHWAAFSRVALGSDEARIAADFVRLSEPVGEMLDRIEAAMEAADIAGLQAIRQAELYAKIDPLTASVEALVQLQLRSARERAALTAWVGSRAEFAGLAIIIGLSALTAAGFLIIHFRIVAPLSRITGAMLALAAGKADFDLGDADSTSEIGDMARALNVFRENASERHRLEGKARSERDLEMLRQGRIDMLIGEFRSGTLAVRSALEQQLASVQSAADNLNDIAARATAGASVAGEASSESNADVALVSRAATELTSASREISSQVHQAGESVDHASRIAREADKDIALLATLGERIGAIVDIINAIAEQTNMLALNATIEAARAGEAGRSFAVVAGEVKNLAGQTAKATQEISEQVAAIQHSTGQAVQHVRTISRTVAEIEGRTAAIASAVEWQEASTQDISRSIARAFGGSQRVAESVVGMTRSIEETNVEARQLHQANGLLLDVMTNFSRTVDEFLERVVEDVKERRAATRRAAAQAALILDGRERRETHLVDISATGFRIEAVEGLKLHAGVEIVLQSGFRTRTRVAWISGPYAGLKADNAIPAGEIERATLDAAA